MLDRLSVGELPRKHHLALRDASGKLRYEHCITRAGFEGPYTIAYHEHRPQALVASGEAFANPCHPVEAPHSVFSRRHFCTPRLEHAVSLSSRVPLLFNEQLTLSLAKPTTPESYYRTNGTADELWFVLDGNGTLRCPLGDLDYTAGDYLFVPKGLLHRLLPNDEVSHNLLVLEFRGGVGIPPRFRNPVGQLRMDAPYSHRDFKRPSFSGPLDEGLRNVHVELGPRAQVFAYEHSPLDVVGWDGTLYPWGFPILNFQPRVSSVHLPPSWHGTFEGAGALVCSFVPRPLEFHPEAVPCPYPHSSADVDEVIFYVAGQFSSRSGVSRGSLTWHPAGVPHGPQPGRYEASLGVKQTDELAVMLDCQAPLKATEQARAIEDHSYEASFTDHS